MKGAPLSLDDLHPRLDYALGLVVDRPDLRSCPVN